MPALASAAIASPPRRKIAADVRLSRVAIPWSAVVAESAPMKAAIGKSSNGSGHPSRSPITMVVVAASAPPLETPTSAGSASGLRNSPCMMSPATARSAPTMLAIAMRGSRIDHSTSRSRAIRSGSPAPNPARGQQAMQRDAGGPDGGGRDGDDGERCQQRADHDHRGAAHPGPSAHRELDGRCVGRGHPRHCSAAVAISEGNSAFVSDGLSADATSRAASAVRGPKPRR